MTKKIKLIHKIKEWLFPQEERAELQKPKKNDLYVNAKRLENPKVLHQYPQANFRFPVIKDEEWKPPTREEQRQKLRKSKPQEEELLTDVKKNEKVVVQKKESKVKKQRFSVKETPSPIYGYRKRPINKETEAFEVEEEIFNRDDIVKENETTGQTVEELIPEPVKISVNEKVNEKNVEVQIEHQVLTRAERRRAMREGKEDEEVQHNEKEEESKKTNDIERKEIQPFNVLMYPKDKRKEEKNRQLQETGYSPPSIHILNVPEPLPSDSDEWIDAQANILNETFDYFNIRAKVVHVTRGPSVTRFEIQPEPGVKVSKITNLTDDLKLSLAAKDIRMEAPIPGKNTIGIEVPNDESTPVYLREIIHHKNFHKEPSPLTVALGMDISGEPIVTDLQKMPHGLIAGATGSGKSVCVNSILVSLLYKASPKEVRLLLIDPKMVELAPFNGIPHLAAPVITDPKEATEGLKWAVSEMERRYELFAKQGTRDLKRYNAKMQKENMDKDVLPYLVVVVDELADLMMVAPHDVEEAICRIAQKARACGIHLLVATQRPSVDVITGLIKANIPSRIAFSVSSQADSRTIIDGGGAERLLGKGDMLFLENGSGKPVRIQGTFVSDEEIDRVIAHVKQLSKPEFLFEKEVLQQQIEIEDEDDLFQEACSFVCEVQTASASLLQRQFRIGYNRAARLIDDMEARGIISGANGSKPRDVFLTKENLDESM
ncbi:DNA translocase FtsK [Evansella cellulosilytica]|uniref:Cell division protein FtsK/SpoIIIE n=1 Tax=Evansella cellulosilytica (strain ATCC 21833 / DSM 2522 / FERM P-1141 / JCM 9156 / N-4) TaxID=649639 RepID=E6U180_EVAC2|nr:DNA translocase FtsK [Evansella cellulosilytica]ADU31526.1 cell division protein FtsK/SpoIIIE [Evansella cellulosilytica DSM 2522]